MSRRSFLGTSLKGLGAAGAGIALGAPLSLLGEAGASASPGTADAPLLVEPPEPTTHRSYVSRPDLTPPAVNIVSAPGFPYSSDQPKYIFAAANVNPGSVLPKGTQVGLMIFSLSGELIWFKPFPNPAVVPYNFRVQTYKGNSVLTWFQGTQVAGYATAGNYVIANEGYAPVVTVLSGPIPYDLHEFAITSEDTALCTAYESGVAGPHGDIVVSHAREVDISSRQVLSDWASYPAVSPTLSYTGTTGDYFHINSIDVWPGSPRSLLISGRNTSAVYLVDQTTGRITWELGGKASSFKMGAGVASYFQHDARALTDGSGLSMFDDASPPGPETQASGKVITLDQKRLTATLRHQYFHTTQAFDSTREGNCQLLPTGGHLVCWGSEPFFSYYRASGSLRSAELALDGRFEGGINSYRVFMFDWTGSPPLDELALVVKPTGGSGHFTAWVSWNGATEVAAWRLNAGPSVAAEAIITTAAKHSFETAINFTRDGATSFRITALDAKGAVIGRSPSVGAT